MWRERMVNNNDYNNTKKYDPLRTIRLGKDPSKGCIIFFKYYQNTWNLIKFDAYNNQFVLNYTER